MEMSIYGIPGLIGGVYGFEGIHRFANIAGCYIKE